MSQGQFADIIGCHQSHISFICAGERRPSPELAEKIEKVTDGAITFNELLRPTKTA